MEKTIKLYCPLVTEKSTNPECQINLSRPQHGLGGFDTQPSRFLSHHRTIEVDSIIVEQDSQLIN